jgi:hypothetical protein
LLSEQEIKLLPLPQLLALLHSVPEVSRHQLRTPHLQLSRSHSVLEANHPQPRIHQQPLHSHLHSVLEINQMQRIHPLLPLLPLSHSLLVREPNLLLLQGPQIL